MFLLHHNNESIKLALEVVASGVAPLVGIFPLLFVSHGKSTRSVCRNNMQQLTCKLWLIQ